MSMSSSSVQEIRTYRGRSYKVKHFGVFKSLKGLQFSETMVFTELPFNEILVN